MNAEPGKTFQDVERAAAAAFELLGNLGYLPCTRCWGLGLIPAEAFGRDSDGAPVTDDEERCPEGCAIPGWLVAERNDNRSDQEETVRLRARVAELESATEWGAKWSDGGYCPATGVNWATGTAESAPDRDEEFVRRHARSWGTKVIRRQVGPWVYADTGDEVVW